MVDIVVDGIAPAQNSPDRKEKKRRFMNQRRRSRQRDRRHSQSDRRQAVRDGVVVTLSFAADRRKLPDRRKGSP